MDIIISSVPVPGVHGGDAVQVASALGVEVSGLIDLSASLNPFAPDVARFASKHLSALTAYPDDQAATQHMASALGVDTELLVLTNGGAEAISLVAAELGAGWVEDPEFALYRRHLPLIDPEAGRWRSNPSNPLGHLAPPEATAAVWDEAFYPIATGEWTRGDASSWRLGSLTKLWSCAGLRLGYVIAPTVGQAEAIRTRRPQWSVNGLALALVPELLAATELKQWAVDIATLRDTFVASLTGLGFAVSPSEANWVLVTDQVDLRSRLAGHGVLVRDCSNFGLANTTRIALPTASQLDPVMTAIERVSRV